MRHAVALVCELVGLHERPLYPGDDFLEVAGSQERFRADELLVVLAGDVERRMALAGRSALVVEDADRRPVVDERVEQDRPRVATTQSTCWSSVASMSRSV